MPIAKRLARDIQRLAEQRLSGGQVTLGLQQHADVDDAVDCGRVLIAERLAARLQRLAEQRLSGGEVALDAQ